MSMLTEEGGKLESVIGPFLIGLLLFVGLTWATFYSPRSHRQQECEQYANAKQADTPAKCLEFYR